jgi:hypothetical protein
MREDGLLSCLLLRGSYFVIRSKIMLCISVYVSFICSFFVLRL